MQWRLLKLFPPPTGCGLNEQTLTEAQWYWLQCQMLLDEGIDACPSCEALGPGPYCSACGMRLRPTLHTCAQCHLQGAGAYCSGCGEPLGGTVTAQVEAGTFDWQGWAKSLTPFLGGLSPQEELLLAQDVGSNGT